MAAVWFYSHDNVRKGPIDLQTLRLLISSGALVPHALVWREGMPVWRPASGLAELDPAADPKRVPVPSLPHATKGPVPKKVSRTHWIIGGIAVAALGVVCVVIVALIIASASNISDESAAPQLNADQQLSKDVQELHDAFTPAK